MARDLNSLSQSEKERLAYALAKAQRKASTAAGSIGVARAFGYLEQAVLEIVGRKAVARWQVGVTE